MVRAMQEAGIPIDIVGGVSIGSFIGGLWCEETNITRFTQRAREFSRVSWKIYVKAVTSLKDYILKNIKSLALG